MKDVKLKVVENIQLTPTTYKMCLEGDVSAVTTPGQFINIQISGLYLRRPISVCDCDGKTVTIIYKVVGHGTEQMKDMPVGTVLDVLTGLGNGFDVNNAGDQPVLVGGGVGVAPMYWLARALAEAGKKPVVILGFNTKDEVFYEEAFKAVSQKLVIATADGSYGLKGFVTDAMKDLEGSYLYTCGPEPMLKAVFKSNNLPGEYSFEERMGCGFGACMGCTCKTLTGYKRICKDGPVLRKEEILWEA